MAIRYIETETFILVKRFSKLERFLIFLNFSTQVLKYELAYKLALGGQMTRKFTRKCTQVATNSHFNAPARAVIQYSK